MNKKTFVISALVLTIGSGALFTASQVSAQDANIKTTLAQRIAEKFGLKQEDVQAVFDEHHEEHHAQMQTRFEERLTQLVKDGKLTEAQKQAIAAKVNELYKKKQANLEKLRSMTPEQRKEAMQSERQSLEEWAKQQNIDLSLLKGIGHKFVLKGHGFGMKGIDDNYTKPSRTPVQ